MLDATLSAGKRHKLPVSLLLVDIDHFKHVNDTHGHHVGDQVLIHVANILRASVRKEDVVGRWGGEEFLAVLPHTDAGGAAELAKRLCDDVGRSPFQAPGGVSVTVTVSVGSVDEPRRSRHRVPAPGRRPRPVPSEGRRPQHGPGRRPGVDRASAGDVLTG